MLDEFVNFESWAIVLSQSGNRALGTLRNKIRNFKDCRYQLLLKYITHVWHLYLIMVLVFGDITDSARMRQFRTGICATSWEFIVLHQTMQFKVIWGGPYVRLAENYRCAGSGIVSLPINRLLRINFDEEYNVTNPRYENWVSEMYNIFHETEFIDVFESNAIYGKYLIY